MTWVGDAKIGCSILCGDLAIKQIEEGFVDNHAMSGEDWTI